MDNIIERHEGYTKITYPRKRVILLHSIWDEDGINDTYPNLWPGEPEIIFDEDMTVNDIGYRTGCFINRFMKGSGRPSRKLTITGTAEKEFGKF